MKKGQQRLVVFSILLVLSSLMLISIHLVSAAVNYNALNTEGYYCAIVASNACGLDSNNNQGYVIMGLSAATNAHGEFPYQSYPNVLCCYFGSGVTTTSSVNKILGLYSSTNSHAEIPSDTNYNTIVGYKDIQCVNVASCDSTYPIEVVSLISPTNSHIGSYTDYTNKICCQIPDLQLSCILTSTSFSTSSAIAGGSLDLIANGTNCAGMTVDFTISDKSSAVKRGWPVSSYTSGMNEGKIPRAR